MDVETILQIVRDGGIIGLLLIILVGGAKKWWVWGWIYEESELRNVKQLETWHTEREALIREKDEWKDLALSGSRITESALEVARPRAGRRAAQ